VITGEPSVASTFNVDQYACNFNCNNNNFCREICTVTTESLPVSTTVTPAWFYSYQCSSAILVNYIPVLLLVQALTGIGLPSLGWLYVHAPVAWVDRWVPRYYSNWLLRGLNALRSDTELPSIGVLNVPLLMSKRYLSVAMMMTFGLACPLLSVLVAIDAWTNDVVLRAQLLRLVCVHSASEDKCRLVSVFTLVESEFRDFSAGCGKVLVMVAVFASLFWSAFVFDMMGDVYGALVGGLMMLVPVLGTALCCWFAAVELYQFLDAQFLQETIVESATHGRWSAFGAQRFIERNFFPGIQYILHRTLVGRQETNLVKRVV
jgi:hypothetical protein